MPKTLKSELYPLFSCSISAGFPSPASDYIDQRLDLNQYLGMHSEATFFLRVQGDSMQGAGIFDGDLLIVDRSVQAKSGNVVIAVVDGEFTVKRLQRRGGITWLKAENPAYRPIEFKDGQELEIWGVVSHVVHKP
ncbi:LexA family protein [Polynucleobacter kasalickyi]|uniref:DNA polymerase V n=1 Tax=Polynucleobacter kasalickyi TaxID=1938817 RepID=A0A1W2B267_9BURK|nr:translesion error-prone DNA polymerase V autoproteolytic subunit [Polynucleobacter kasalickyi]SMC67016.1 DNA polymerase V [Polynucleobacter kasalickyi]